jgi:AraC-like DNA-binding protein
MNGITGYSTISYVLKVKLHKARRMLAETSSKIADVSEACGFQDSSYFSRAFKKEFGFTPSQIQRRPEVKNDTLAE